MTCNAGAGHPRCAGVRKRGGRRPGGAGQRCTARPALCHVKGWLVVGGWWLVGGGWGAVLLAGSQPADGQRPACCCRGPERGRHQTGEAERPSVHVAARVTAAAPTVGSTHMQCVCCTWRVRGPWSGVAQRVRLRPHPGKHPGGAGQLDGGEAAGKGAGRRRTCGTTAAASCGLICRCMTSTQPGRSRPAQPRWGSITWRWCRCMSHDAKSCIIQFSMCCHATPPMIDCRPAWPRRGWTTWPALMQFSQPTTCDRM